MSWAYNQIDIYFMSQEMPLSTDDTVTPSINDRYWNAASTYGIVRGRPTLTPASMNGQGVTIPGRNGTVYSSSSTRGNAKLQIDILVDNSWVHNETQNGTVTSRADILMTLIRDAKYISYKMPGVPADFYLKVTRKVDVTVGNLDKNAVIVQATLEVKPFKYKFTGLKPIIIEPNTAVEIPIKYPNGICKPLLWFRTMYGSGYINFKGKSQVLIVDQVIANTILDTEECLCYLFDEHDEPISQNGKFKGDYRELWIPKIEPEDVDGGQNWNTSKPLWQNIGQIYYYTKEGVDL